MMRLLLTHHHHHHCTEITQLFSSTACSPSSVVLAVEVYGSGGQLQGTELTTMPCCHPSGFTTYIVLRPWISWAAPSQWLNTIMLRENSLNSQIPWIHFKDTWQYWSHLENSWLTLYSNLPYLAGIQIFVLKRSLWQKWDNKFEVGKLMAGRPVRMLFKNIQTGYKKSQSYENDSEHREDKRLNNRYLAAVIDKIREFTKQKMMQESKVT